MLHWPYILENVFCLFPFQWESIDSDILSPTNDFAEPSVTSASLAILERIDGLIIRLLNLFMVWLVLLANDNDFFKELIGNFGVKSDCVILHSVHHN